MDPSGKVTHPFGGVDLRRVMPELTGFPSRGTYKGKMGAMGYLILKFLEHQWVRFFKDLLV